LTSLGRDGLTECGVELREKVSKKEQKNIERSHTGERKENFLKLKKETSPSGTIKGGMKAG